MGGDLTGDWLEVDERMFHLLHLIIKLEHWTDVKVPSDSSDGFFAQAMLVVWRLDPASATATPAVGNVLLY